MPGRRDAARETEPDASDEGQNPRNGTALESARRALIRAFARLPRPTRLLWIFLAVLGAYGLVFNLEGIGLLPLLILPVLAIEADLLFQGFRFRSIRAPDSALATGMFLALLLPPTVPLVQAGVVTVAAIILRHVVRYRERPILNPAVVGVLFGALLFGMAPAWWGSINVGLVVLLGIVLTVRSPGSWRMPVAFLPAYAALSVLRNLPFGTAINPQVLLLGALDPSILFFALFMVPEPRTAPVEPLDRLFFGAAVGIGTALLPAILPSLAPLVALVLGNVMAVALRWLAASPALDAGPVKRKSGRRGGRAPRKQRRPQHSLTESRRDWTTAHRVAAGLFVFALLGTMAVALNPPTATPFAAVRPSLPPNPVGTSSNGCTADNPSVSSSLLSFLHNRLGPSVILSVDSSSGTVVFYDPVNHVTVTETDMYEDFGYAEFNGDDYAVSGCAG